MNNNTLMINNAIAQGLDVVGDRWALLILCEAFLGFSRFEEFRQNTGASRTTLTRRLESLLAADVFYKRSYTASGKRFEYKLTEKGMGLFSTSLLCWQWELEWTDINVNKLPPRLFHSACGHPLTSRAVCRNCNETLKVGDVDWPDIKQDLSRRVKEIQHFNKRRVRSAAGTGEKNLSLAYVSDLVGDRWTILLLTSAFFGVKRYDVFLKQLNIASNILTDRLNMLVDVDVLNRVNYQENPPRSEYNLTVKGKSLYPLVMAMRQWVVDWLPQNTPYHEFRHKTCGKPLVVKVICDSCEQRPWRADVRLME